jgi:hypothetical protein
LGWGLAFKDSRSILTEGFGSMQKLTLDMQPLKSFFAFFFVPTCTMETLIVGSGPKEHPWDSR